MKTIFKVGMVVYDQLNFPDKEGKVVDICKDERVTSPITVIFKDKYDEEIERYYTSDGRYKTGELTVLSTKPYQIILQGFEQKAPAPTYEEAVRWLESTEGTNIMEDSVFLTKGNYYTNLNKCTEALKKLIILRDYYNEGWQPDWDINKVKYIIKRHGNRHFSNIETSENHPSVLYFKSKEIRDKFLKEQRELLEIAKPLL